MDFLLKRKLKKLQKRARILYDKRERGETIDAKYEIKAQLDLAHFYDKYRYYKIFPRAESCALEYYRTAAELGSAEAQYTFGQRRLEDAKFWDEWFAGINGQPLHQELAKSYYTEAFNNLSKAESNGYPLAKRLYGLAYIHGWGVPKDKDRGFKMVVESIEEEGSWNRATQIFTELGLNTPDFFSSIMAIKQKK